MPLQPFRPWQEAGAALIVVLASLTATAPLLRPAAIGGADAYHYALQAADFDAQVRAGVFPVLVGQSIFGFNGNIHTLRTAPYYVHLCGAINGVTGGLLSPYGIQNLAAIISALGGATTAWLAARSLAPSGRWIPSLLAALYVTSASVTGRFLVGDLYASYTTVPWIPLIVLGAVQCVEERDIRGPSLLTAGALAMAWYAHPPTGMLLLPVPFVAAVLRLAKGPDRVRDVGAALAAAVGFFMMTWYLVYSVKSMRLDYSWQGWSAEGMTYNISRAKPDLAGFFGRLPMSDDPPVGYVTLALILIGYCMLRRGRAGPWLLAAVVVAYTFAFVSSPMSNFLWHGPFFAAIPVIIPWPIERCRPIFCVVAVVWGAEALPRISLRGPGWRLAVVVALIVGLTWNLVQLRKLMPVPPWSETAPRTIPERSVVLTRSSYLLFGEFPGYFSNGHMDPEAETRLLNRDLVEPDVTNAGYLFAQQGPDSAWQSINRMIDLPLEAGKGCALEFKFGDPGQAGELTASSGSLHRIYSLPSSGGRFAFGSTASSSHVLMFGADDGDGKSLHMTSSIPGISVRQRFYTEDELPLRVVGLIPFEARVRAVTGGYLESPRCFIPGYRATVDGRPVGVMRSPEGMAMVPIPAGRSDVRIDYAGPPLLRTAYFVSLIGILAWPWVTRDRYRRPERSDSEGKPAGRWRKIAISGAALAIILCIARASAALIASTSTPELAIVDGTVKMGVVFPRWPRNKSEPVLVLGRFGSADVIFVRYDDPEHIRIGFDDWGVGGPISESIRYAPGRVYQLEMSLPRLRAGSLGGDAPPGDGRTRIAIDGTDVIFGDLQWHHLPPTPMGFGANLIGASSCASRFSGGMFRPDGSVISP